MEEWGDQNKFNIPSKPAQRFWDFVHTDWDGGPAKNDGYL